MTSRKRLERRGAVAAAAVTAAAISVPAALLIPVPPAYEPYFFPALYAVCAVALSVLFMRLTKTL